MANNEQKKKRNILIILALIFVIGIAAGFIFGRMANNGGKETTTAQSTTAIESTTAGTTKSTTTAESTSAEPSTEITSDESTTKNQTTATTKKAEGDYDLPMTINTALDALQEHYGPKFEINSTVEEGGLNYFSVYKGGDKYASVAVNLKTGDATETLAANGNKTNFSLVK